ncbi:hypothetical protein CCP4SC76_1220001 [Gammaproteobacteria bacterium]
MRWVDGFAHVNELAEQQIGRLLRISN